MVNYVNIPDLIIKIAKFTIRNPKTFSLQIINWQNSAFQNIFYLYKQNYNWWKRTTRAVNMPEEE
jgi:hypothetical protein